MLVCLAIVSSVGIVTAAPLEKAKAAIDNSEYFAARTELEAALRAGDNKPADLAEIHRLSGVVAAALGDATAAKEAFQRCLALAPQTTLPAGTSPKIAKPFAAAQDFLKDKQPLQIKPATTSDPPTVTIEVVADPLNMIAKLRAIAIVDGKPEQTLDKPADKLATVKIDLPKGKRIDLRVVAIDEHGNHLSEVGSTEVPIVIIGKPEGPVVVTPIKKPPPKVEQPRDPRPLYLQWWLWAGASGVFLATGSYFAIDAVRAKNELQDLGEESGNHPFDTVKPVEDRARRSVLIANIGLVTGGALAIATGVLYLTRPKRVTERRVVLSPAASSTTVGLVLGGAF